MSANFTAPYAVPGLGVILPATVNIDLTMGAVVTATWCSVFAFGMVCAAAYIYYMAFPKDQLAFKVLVGFIWALSTLDTISNMVWSYDWTVKMWGMIPGTTTLPHAFYINLLCCTTACLVVQFFYAWRIWRISNGEFIIPILIGCCAVVQLIIMLYVLPVKWGANVQMADMGRALPVAYGWAISGVIGDVIISAALFYYLSFRTRGGAHSEQSRLSFNAIISRAVQANIFSLVSQVMTFVLFKIDAGLFFFLNDVILCKVYAFALLTTLNARRSSTTMFNSSGLASQSNSVSMDRLSGGRRSNMQHQTIGGTGRPVKINQTIDIVTTDDSYLDIRDQKHEFAAV